jgi:hypothetical protein
MDTAHRIYRRLGFVRRPERDVAYETWREDPEMDLPPEWIGQSFLAYAWSPLTG